MRETVSQAEDNIVDARYFIKSMHAKIATCIAPLGMLDLNNKLEYKEKVKIGRER